MPEKTPLQVEKEQKIADLSGDAESPENNEPAKKKRGPKRGRPKKVVEPEQPFNPEQSLRQGMFFMEMMSNMRKGMGIEKPIPELTQQTFINSIPAMEQKYGAVVSKYMPEMMFFGSTAMILFDTAKELKAIKMAEKQIEPGEKDESGKTPDK